MRFASPRGGFEAGRRHIGTRMVRMRIEALYRKPLSSAAGRGNPFVSPARSRRRAAQPGVGGGHHLSFDAPRLPLPVRRDRLVLAAGSRLAAVEHLDDQTSVWTWSAKLSTGTAARKSSTPIRVASSPAANSPGCSRRTVSGSAGAARGPGETTSLSSACGRPSSTRKCISRPMTASVRRKPTWLAPLSALLQRATASSRPGG